MGRKGEAQDESFTTADWKCATISSTEKSAGLASHGHVKSAGYPAFC